MTPLNRLGRPIDTLLARTDLHPRLVYGTDYPLPAINALIRISDFVDGGYLERREGEQLRELYVYNPILFDFVAKRRMKHPETGQRFPASVFEGNAALP